MGGKVVAHTNNGKVGSSWSWTDRGAVASGVGHRGGTISFGNIGGVGRADYIYVKPKTNEAWVWWNRCPGPAIPAPPNSATPTPTPSSTSPPVSLPAVTGPAGPQVPKCESGGKDWLCLQCKKDDGQDTDVGDIRKKASERWKAGKGDEVLKDHHQWWNTVNRDELDEQKSYVRALSWRYEGPANWVCDVASTGGCDQAVDCDETRNPTVSMIMDQVSINLFHLCEAEE